MIRFARVLACFIVGFCICRDAPAKNAATESRGPTITLQFHTLVAIYGRIEGRFERVRGTIDLDPNNIARSNIYVEVDTASINSNHRLRDAYLRGRALLSARRYPKAYFRSSMIRTRAGRVVLVKGYLTLRGVTRPLTIRSARRKRAKRGRGDLFVGTTSFDLSYFGIPRPLGFIATRLHLTMRVKQARP